MRLPILLIALLGSCPAAAEPPVAPKTARSEPAKPVPMKGAGNPCAGLGAGFVKVEGTSTCVKVGGSMDVSVGSSLPRR